MFYDLECPYCDAIHECECDPGEHFVDIPDECDECGKKFTQEFIFEQTAKAEEDAAAKAYDYFKDRD